MAAGVFFAWRYYKRVFASNVSVERGEEAYLYIPTGADFEEVVDSLAKHEYLKNEKSFRWLAQKKSYVNLVKPGRYLIEAGWSNNTLIDVLRAGDQEPLNLVIYDVNNLVELAGRLGSTLEQDSLSFLNFLRDDDTLSHYGCDSRSVLAYFIPNTYQFYWNSSPGYTLKKMKEEFDKYWTSERVSAAKAQNLTPLEVVTLASIVERETIKKDEMPTVAGLYLNRLERGILLQSDPTAVFGYLLDFPEDYPITRVYYKHIRYPSDYNTYQHPGLPPGPIKAPGKAAIEAVLHPENNEYLFMMADAKRPGYHKFAKNNAQHDRNRREYHAYLNGR